MRRQQTQHPHLRRPNDGKDKANQSISDRTPPVSVEYDYGTKGERRTKEFDDAQKAKKFFIAKDKAGKNPKVQKADDGTDTGNTTKDETRETTTKSEPKKPTTPGVRAMRSRPYLAGVIIAKHGLAAGVTDAMVAELDEAYGKPNPTESTFCLKSAWHAARGFTGEAV